ncbi:hypothetical protein GGR58DRAFT_169357 [Xylaria digitata]|nr:hypothetical protein GGR58DRAFT_169357 [Xylaria digitata]
MANRGGSKTRFRRAPLGDATDRILNTSPQKPGKYSKLLNPEPNPLRAHPTSLSSTKASSQNAKASSSSNQTSNLRGVAISSNANPRHSSAPRGTTPSVKDTYGDQRSSLLSTSSGTSGANRKTHIGPWQLGKTLGKGSAARVRLARHCTTHDIVAVKILAKDPNHMTAAGSMAELDQWDRTRDEFHSQRHIPLAIEREVAILKLIDHPHIVKLHDIWENRAEIYLVMEYMDCGDMFSYINNYGPLPEFETVGYFRQILSALEYVHSFNICHRDLKPENILMKSDGVVKIADFGMAAIQQSPTHALRTSCGSPHYAAPELIARSRYQGNKVDIWSLGCLLYVTLSRSLPFDDPNGNVPKLLAKAAKGAYIMPDFLSKEAQDLIARMLTVDPVKRISIRRIWQHPLLRKYDDLDSLNDGGRILDSRASDKSRPVQPEELDLQILRQLKSMWHTFSEKQIAMQLSNALPNDQKLFYWLLLNYREKKLEDYDMNLTFSASDYHHLRPANWKKKFTTAEFPSRYGRVPSRFTVISTVPTDGSIEGADNATDGGTTSKSYDPYKSSRIIENVYASHAKIVVHRNGSTANNSSRSSASRRGQSGSFRSTSTRSRQTRGGRRINAPAALRASRQSLSSIQSGESIPYMRPASRRKRRVDFSHVRIQPGGCEVARSSTSATGDDATHNYGHTAPVGSVRNTKLPGGSNKRKRTDTQSPASMPQANHVCPPWNEEVRQFSYSIAKDCDDAFNDSLLSPKSYLGNTSNPMSALADETLLSNRLATPTSAPNGNNNMSSDAHPWDRRPLPPTPSSTASAIDELIMEKIGIREQSENSKASKYISRGASLLGDVPLVKHPMMEDEPNRRTISAPIYSQYSTQWGKNKIPLPSINERSNDRAHVDTSSKYRVVSAPAGYQKPEIDDHTDFEFLSRQDNTIRIVTSPSVKPHAEVKAPESPDTRKHISRDATAYPQSTQELSFRQRYAHDEPTTFSSNGQEAPPEDSINSTTAKKKSLWFKRGSKDSEALVGTKGKPSLGRAAHPTSTDTNSAVDPGNPPTKKKGFNIAFWRNSKHESQIHMSLAGAGPERYDTPSPKPPRMFSHPARPPCDSKWVDEATTRNIEPQQNWLARLFRVKPATKHLCFSISRRRARQEIFILLKDWRKYGIRDVEVDKERNIVFARVGKENYLNLKEVAFAAEIMTVIEHGKRSQLCIARITQERGAASSFHKVVDTMKSVFDERGLLIAEERKIKMMIKTLNS